MKRPILEKSSAVVVFHEYTTGIGQDLRDYLLKQKIQKLLFISHPLLYIKDGFKKVSYYEWYVDGKLVNRHEAMHWKLPEYFLYIKDFFYTFYWISSKKVAFDFYFGIGNLNAGTGILLKRMKMIKKSIYYVIDYVPRRFTSHILNNIYHAIEAFSAEHSDATWNLSPRMIEAREKRWNKKFPHQLVVPHGVHVDRIKRLPFEKINRHEIIYIGSLLKKQGIQLVLESFPEILRKVPEARFTIIGKGPYEHELKTLVRDLKLDTYVTFLGYIESHEELENRIAKAAIAVGLYNREADDFTYYADPGKVKNYLGAGVPIVMTDVPHVAQEIKKASCGFIINYNKSEMIETLCNFFSDANMMKKYRTNAVNFSQKYEWSYLYNNAFRSLLP